MMKANFEGKTYNFPDDATDEEITQFFDELSPPLKYTPEEIAAAEDEGMTKDVGANIKKNVTDPEFLKGMGKGLGEAVILAGSIIGTVGIAKTLATLTKKYGPVVARAAINEVKTGKAKAVKGLLEKPIKTVGKAAIGGGAVYGGSKLLFP